MVIPNSQLDIIEILNVLWYAKYDDKIDCDLTIANYVHKGKMCQIHLI